MFCSIKTLRTRFSYQKLSDQTQKQINTRLAPILIGVWAIALLFAFFANRGSDIGQMPKLIGNLGGWPIFGAGIVDSIIGSVVALLIVFAWFGLGNFTASFIRITKCVNRSHLLELAMQTSVGAAIWSLVWFFLGIAGLYHGVTALIATLAGIVLAVKGIRKAKEAQEESRVPESSAGFNTVLLLLIAIPVILAFAASLAPPTAKDTLLYHFAVPKAFIAQGSNAFIEGNIASYLALGTEMHTVWAMLLGGFWSSRAAEAAAGATVFFFFPLLLTAIFGWARELGASKNLSLVAVLMFASVPTAYHVASSGYIDISLALFITLAAYWLCSWWKTQENISLAIMAIFLGAALAIKLTSVFFFAAFALIILLKARSVKNDSSGKMAASGFAALILAGAIASPWYLHTWNATGSPVFPFYMSIWKGEATGWDVERSNLFQTLNSHYGGSNKTAADYLLAPWNLSVAAQPEQAEYFDGVLGVAFLFAVPFLIWGLWKFDPPIEAKIGSGIAAIIFLFWLFSSQQLRYLLPILPLLIIAVISSVETTTTGENILRKTMRFGLIASAVAAIMVSSAWFLQRAPLRVVLGGETRDEYLARNLDYYPYYSTLNADTPTDAKVWLINMRRDTYNIERPVFSDYLFEDWTLRKMVWESRSAEEMRSKTAAMGIQYVMTRHDFLFDYDRSTLVDDMKTRAENETKLKIAKEFILGRANTVRADNKFSLVKVF